ncbi:hypothetical protein AN958_03127 [Leucoagaricus sp. SymC.cos]|nr:hypothetical protein AN958_03127 [Leucoagaricus sp. SymC.cos]
MWSRAAGLSDGELTDFSIEKNLTEVRSGATSYGNIIFGKIQIPAINDAEGVGSIHVRIHDPPNRDFNIRTGAKYFADTLDDLDGDVLKAVGRYNGWCPGLTVKKTTATKCNGCCRCQQNLDYLHQLLKGWCQNINAHDLKLGTYDNLKDCPL